MRRLDIQSQPEKRQRSCLHLESLEDRTAPASAVLSSPLSFELNQGQTYSSIDYIARGDGYSLFLDQDQALLALNGSDGTIDSLKMSLIGSNSDAEVSGLDARLTRSNYLIGNNQSEWITEVPHFGRIEYSDVYAGIDLAYYGTSSNQIEYDFIVAPRTDPERIRLQFSGVNALTLDDDGNLVLQVNSGDVIQQAPFIYQESAGKRVQVDGHYVLHNNNEVGFAIGNYDSNRTLVIDPIVTYFNYLGSGNADSGNDIAVDIDGKAYIVGDTVNTDFGIDENPTPKNFALTGNSDVFIARYNEDGTELEYLTFLGGDKNDTVAGLALDSSGAAYLTGTTSSANFPVENAFKQTIDEGAPEAAAVGADAFVTKLSPDGSKLVYSTYLGERGNDKAFDIAVDSEGKAYVTGVIDRITVAPFEGFDFTSKGQAYHANDINWSGKFLDGNGNENGSLTLFLEDGHLTGISGGTVPNNPQFNFSSISFNDNESGKADILEANPLPFVNNTFSFSRTNNNIGISFDIQGQLDSPRKISGTLNYQVNRADGISESGTRTFILFKNSEDNFIAQFSVDGSEIEFSTSLPGQMNSIAVDSSGDIYVAGVTTDDGFPVANETQSLRGSNDHPDAFVAKLNIANLQENTDSSGLLFSTFLGGEMDDSITDLFIEEQSDDAGNPQTNIYVVGTTESMDFPTVNAFQQSLAGSTDAFITKFDEANSELVYSTYLGNTRSDSAQGVVVDARGQATVFDTTTSRDDPATDDVNEDFPHVASNRPINARSFNTFLSTLTPDGNELRFSTILGGSSEDRASAIALHDDQYFVTGKTFSNGLGTDFAFETRKSGNFDAFAAKIREPIIVNIVEDLEDPNPDDDVPDVNPDTLVIETSLRAAIEFANKRTNARITLSDDSGDPDLEDFVELPDIIVFNLPDGATVPTITLMAELPAIEESVIIDGSTQQLSHRVDLDGSQIEGDGITINSDDVTLSGLNVNNFIGTGVIVEHPDNEVLFDVVLREMDISLNGTGVLFKDVIFAEISQSEVRLNDNHGLVIDGGLFNEVFGLYSENGQSGVVIQGSDAEENLVSATIEENDQSGVHIKDGATKNIIDGTIRNNSGDGVFIDNSPENIVRSFVITGNTGDGVEIRGKEAKKNRIEGGQIGRNLDDLQVSKNNQNGILINNAPENVVRNVVVVASGANGILISGTEAKDNVLEKNTIGVDFQGRTESFADGRTLFEYENTEHGISIAQGSSNHIIENFVSNNKRQGIRIVGGNAENNQLINNAVGGILEPQEGIFLPRGNQSDGIFINASNTKIFADPASLNPDVLLDTINTIIGNKGRGVHIFGESSKGTLIQGQQIGAFQTKQFDPSTSNFVDTIIELPNQNEGVFISNGATDSLIGGFDGEAEGNLIGFNTGGVVLDSEGGVGHTILGNSIFENVGLGIDLNNDGPTVNDSDDNDNGPNTLLNFPFVTGIQPIGSDQTRIRGFLQSKSGTYRIEAFSNKNLDPSGLGEGETFLGHTEITIGNDGLQSFTITTAKPVTNVSVTATNLGDLSTSEFGALGFVVTTTDDTSDPSPRNGELNDIDISTESLDTSLRSVLETINSINDHDRFVIVFDIPTDEIPVINISKQLPTINKKVTILGNTQPNGGKIVVRGPGSETDDLFDGLLIDSIAFTAKGMTIEQFGGTGINMTTPPDLFESFSLSEVVVQNNGGDGVFANGNRITLTDVQILNNEGVGVRADLGGMVFIKGQNNKINRNERGIVADHVTMQATEISSNKSGGISADNVQIIAVPSDELESGTEASLLKSKIETNGDEGIRFFESLDATNLEIIQVDGRGIVSRENGATARLQDVDLSSNVIGIEVIQGTVTVSETSVKGHTQPAKMGIVAKEIVVNGDNNEFSELDVALKSTDNVTIDQATFSNFAQAIVSLGSVTINNGANFGETRFRDMPLIQFESRFAGNNLSIGESESTAIFSNNSEAEVTLNNSTIGPLPFSNGIDVGNGKVALENVKMRNVFGTAIIAKRVTIKGDDNSFFDVNVGIVATEVEIDQIRISEIGNAVTKEFIVADVVSIKNAEITGGGTITFTKSLTTDNLNLSGMDYDAIRSDSSEAVATLINSSIRSNSNFFKTGINVPNGLITLQNVHVTGFRNGVVAGSLEMQVPPDGGRNIIEQAAFEGIMVSKNLVIDEGVIIKNKGDGINADSVPVRIGKAVVSNNGGRGINAKSVIATSLVVNSNKGVGIETMTASLGGQIEISSGEVCNNVGGDFKGAVPQLGNVITGENCDLDGDGVGDRIESQAPNKDVDNNGVLDSEQQNISSFPNAVYGGFISLVVPDGLALKDVKSVTDPTNGELALQGKKAPVGFVSFTVNNLDVGQEIEIQFVAPPETPIEEFVRFDPETLRITPVDFTEDDDRRIARFKIRDGGPGDKDGTANGVIKDPIAPVFNAAPRFDLGIDAAINQGENFTRTTLFEDLDSDTFTATVDFGDSTGEQQLALTAENTINLSHFYSQSGQFTIIVKVTDDEGFIGTDSFVVTVNNKRLQFEGSNGSDVFFLLPIPGQGILVRSIDGTTRKISQEIHSEPLDQIVIFGHGGRDIVVVSPKIQVDTLLQGGSGNDILIGGGGENILVGGAGNDVLIGGRQRDLLIGGDGRDLLLGGFGDDILIGGSTAFDHNQTALELIFSEWTSDRTYTDRFNNLHGIATSTDRFNGEFFLIDTGTNQTVFDDHDRDFLFDRFGCNWFFSEFNPPLIGLTKRKRKW